MLPAASRSGASRELGTVFPVAGRRLGLGYRGASADAPRPQAGPIGAAPIMGWGAGGSCTPRPPIRPRPAPEPRVLTVVFLGLLLDLLAFTLLLPLLPGLLESHGRAHVSPPLCPVTPGSRDGHAGPNRDSPKPFSCVLVPQDPLYGVWQRGVDWFAAAIRMPAEKRYNSVLFGGMAEPHSGTHWGRPPGHPPLPAWAPVSPSPCPLLSALSLSDWSDHSPEGSPFLEDPAWECRAQHAQTLGDGDWSAVTAASVFQV